MQRPRKGLRGLNRKSESRATLDSFDSSAAHQGPTLMNPMTPKSPPPGLVIQTTPHPDSGVSESNAPHGSNASNASKVLALGADFGVH